VRGMPTLVACLAVPIASPAAARQESSPAEVVEALFRDMKAHDVGLAIVAVLLLARVRRRFGRELPRLALDDDHGVVAG